MINVQIIYLNPFSLLMYVVSTVYQECLTYIVYILVLCVSYLFILKMFYLIFIHACNVFASNIYPIPSSPSFFLVPPHLSTQLHVLSLYLKNRASKASKPEWNKINRIKEKKTMKITHTREERGRDKEKE